MNENIENGGSGAREKQGKHTGLVWLAGLIAVTIFNTTSPHTKEASASLGASVEGATHALTRHGEGNDFMPQDFHPEAISKAIKSLYMNNLHSSAE